MQEQPCEILDVPLKETFISIILEQVKIVEQVVIKHKIQIHENRKWSIINIDVQRVKQFLARSIALDQNMQ